jgi:hypothetical protein
MKSIAGLMTDLDVGLGAFLDALPETQIPGWRQELGSWFTGMGMEKWANRSGRKERWAVEVVKEKIVEEVDDAKKSKRFALPGCNVKTASDIDLEDMAKASESFLPTSSALLCSMIGLESMESEANSKKRQKRKRKKKKSTTPVPRKKAAQQAPALPTIVEQGEKIRGAAVEGVEEERRRESDGSPEDGFLGEKLSDEEIEELEDIFQSFIKGPSLSAATKHMNTDSASSMDDEDSNASFRSRHSSPPSSSSSESSMDDEDPDALADAEKDLFDYAMGGLFSDEDEEDDEEDEEEDE